jgi:mono/diheme cytochrome c family protein
MILSPIRRKIAVLGCTSALALAVVAGGGSASSAATAAKPKPTPVTVAAGRAVFKSSCVGCHTLADAKSHGTVGPNLDKLKPSMKLVVHQVTNGGGGMPAFGGRLSKTKIQAVAKYVSTVAGHGKNTTSAGGLP